VRLVAEQGEPAVEPVSPQRLDRAHACEGGADDHEMTRPHPTSKILLLK
jgi:hypothetical protein